MNYPKNVEASCVKMLQDGITRQSVAMLLSTEYNTTYTEDDVVNIIEQFKSGLDETVQETAMSNAIKILSNRKKLTWIIVAVALVMCAMLAGLIVLGIYITWIPLIVFCVAFIAFVVFEIIWTVRVLNGPPNQGGTNH